MEELIQFAEAKQLPPETCARLYKHVEFQVFHFQSACYMFPNVAFSECNGTAANIDSSN